MTNKEHQIKNSIIYLLPTIVGNLLPLITMPIFTRILTKEDYGAWALALVYAVFMSGLCNFGLQIGYERNFFEYRDQKRTGALLYSTLAFVLSTFLFSIVFTFIFRTRFSQWIIGSPEHGGLLFWTFVATVLTQMKMYYLTYFKNMEDAKPYVWYTIDENILGVVFSLFFVAYLKIGVIGLVWGPLLASLIILSILAVRFLRILPLVFDWQILKQNLTISFPLTPRIFLGVIGSQFDKYLLGLLGTIGGVGVYSIGQRIGYFSFNYMTAIQNVYSPQVYKKMFDLDGEGGRSVGRYLTPFAYVSIAVAFLIALFSQEIIVILTPVSYHGAIDIVTIFCMLYGSMFFGKQPQLIYAKKTIMTSILTMISIVLNVGINIPFIMKWGAIGAAWGTLIAGLISGSLGFGISQHYYKIEWEYKKLAAIFFTFFGFSILIVSLRSLNVAYPLLLGVKVAALLLFIWIGKMIDVINKENYQLIKRMLLQSGKLPFSSKRIRIQDN